MSKTLSQNPLLALLCAAAIVPLQGCSDGAPPSQTAQKPPIDEAATQTSAEAAEAVAGAAGRCGTGTVALASQAIGGRNLLHRKGESDVLPIFSLKTDSNAWQTDCPVPMTAQRSTGASDCVARALLPQRFSLSLAREAGADAYRLHLRPTHGATDAPLLRKLHPVYAPSPDRKHVTWLFGAADDRLGADIYLYLRDTNGETSNNVPHKHYVLEVFDADCAAHLPHLSTCRSEDFREGADCDIQLAKRGSDQIGTRQTDTGTGNEPPRP
jgi:hypothetical protein